jgi:hypothetical protein
MDCVLLLTVQLWVSDAAVNISVNYRPEEEAGMEKMELCNLVACSSCV